MTIEEEDGSPSNVGCGTLEVTNGTLSDDLDGRYSLDTSGSSTTGWTRTGTTVSLTNAGDTVGIGTTSPAALLHVQPATAANTELFVRSGNDANWARLFVGRAGETAMFGVSSGAAIFTAGDSAGDLVIRSTGNDIHFSTDTGATTQMTLLNGGNVGIGDTNPGATLTVAATGSLAIPNGTGPTVDAAGELAQDTTDDQLLYGATPRVLAYERTVCLVIEDLAAADDNFAFYMAGDAITVTSVGCNCRGTCSTLATFTLEDRGGNAMTITGTNPTCATTGAATFAAVTAAGGLTAGEMVAFDVTNTPTSNDEYALCITVTTDRQ